MANLKDMVDAQNKERAELAELMKLEARSDGQNERAETLMTSLEQRKPSIESMQRAEALIDAGEIAAQRNDDVSNDMSAKDKREYSFMAAIRSIAANRELSGLEREISDEIAKRQGKDARGFFAPVNLLARNVQKRDLDTTAGAGLIATEHDDFIPLLRSSSVLGRAGATILPGLQGLLSLRKQTAGATAYWVAEGGAPTKTNATYGAVSLAPKSVAAYTDITRQQIKQSSLAMEQLVVDDLTQSLTLAIDKAGLAGGGSNEPSGVIDSVTVTTSGGVMNWSNINQLEENVDSANALNGSLGFVSNARGRFNLKTTERVVGQDRFIMEDSNNLLGYDYYNSNQLVNTYGGDNAQTPLIFGNWSDLVIGMWGALDINIDTASNSNSGGLRVVAFQDVDIALRHTESFAYSTFNTGNVTG